MSLVTETATDGSLAIFSECMKYRYWLERPLGAGEGTLAFVMLNPSTADAFRDDPTVARCRRRAQENGVSRLVVVNLFALRSPDPRDLVAAHRRGQCPIGTDNDRFISRAAHYSTIIVCGWGASVPSIFRRRPGRVLSVLQGGGELRCLGTTKSGAPRHPLYIPSAAPLEPFPPLTPL
jgi:hypothetical protein